MSRSLFKALFVGQILSCCLAVAGEAVDARAAMQAAVRADWEAQESRCGRAPQSPAAIHAALQRTRALLEDLRATGVAGLTSDAAALQRLAERDRDADSMNEASRRELYYEIRTLGRNVAFKNPLVTSQPILFMKRHRAVGYMLYEYLGWYYAYGYDPTNGAKDPRFRTPPSGGGIFVLEQPGRSMRVKELTAGQFPAGHFVTLSLSFDAQTIYFAFADPTGQDPYTLPHYQQTTAQPGVKYNTFHIYAMDADGRNLRQLTDGPNDDFDPCPLPDGGIAFESTRRGSKLRCGGGSPELVYTLHRMDADGRNVRTLSAHETHEWHPSVLADGRIVYTRWDYVDRDAARFHGLWTCLPDGSRPSVLFGNHTARPWASYQAKAIPGSDRIAFIAGGHHANVGGALMVLDPAKTAWDSASGVDREEALQCLTPDVCFPEAEGWPKSYFYSPWPLSEDYYLVAFSHDPLPGGYTGEYRDTPTGLYYFDRFGNLELLYRDDGIGAAYPIPLTPRPRPAQPASSRQSEEADGEFLIADVTNSLLPLPSGGPIRELRVFQLLPKSRTDNAYEPRIGHPDQANARMLLGSVPVEEDGSAYFRAPANKPLYFQIVNQAGRAVQGMRSVVYLQPGERRGCVGCHEPSQQAAGQRTVRAAYRKPSVIRPGPEGTRPFGYMRLIQPLLVQHCVRCHDGQTSDGKSAPDLTGELTEHYCRSYDALLPYLRWPPSQSVTRPGQLGADTSPLAAVLVSAEHRRHVELPDEQLRVFYLWLDAHVPFFGSYEEHDLAAQRQGLAIPPPSLQ